MKKEWELAQKMRMRRKVNEGSMLYQSTDG